MSLMVGLALTKVSPFYQLLKGMGTDSAGTFIHILQEKRLPVNGKTARFFGMSAGK